MFIALGAGSAGAICGDGVLEAGESCDDAGTVSGDGCSAACREEPRDAYKCYKAKGTTFPVPPIVGLTDAYGSTSVDVIKPATLCTPVDRDGIGISDERTSLLCYKVRRGSFTPQTVGQSDPLGTTSLDLTSRKLLCVAARHVGDDYAESEVFAGYSPSSAGLTTIGNDLLVAGGSLSVVSRIDANGTAVQTYVPPLGASFSFGSAVAVRGNDVVVGDLGADPGNGGKGAAYVFDGDTGALLLTLTSPTPDLGDAFGQSVAAVGNDILVGDAADEWPGYRAGAVYLFDGGSGDLLHTTLNPDPREVPDFFGDPQDDFAFGFRIVTLGSHALVVARDLRGGDNGVSAVYEIDPTTGAVFFTYLGHLNRIKVTSSDLLFDDRFGRSLAVSGSGSELLVGAEHADVRNVSQAGAAYVYDTTSHVATLFIPDPQPATTHRFGNTVAFAGSNLLVGDPPRTRLYAPDGLLLRTFTEPLTCIDCPVLGWDDRIVISAGGNIHLFRDTCPDGVLDPGEECDDGNSDAGDGCAPDCRVEPGHHVACYIATRPVFVPVSVSLADRFETKTAQARWPSSACAPTSIDGGGMRGAAAFLTCYDIKDDPDQAKFPKQRALVRDQFGAHTLSLKKARTLCVPATQP